MARLAGVNTRLIPLVLEGFGVRAKAAFTANEAIIKSAWRGLRSW